MQFTILLVEDNPHIMEINSEALQMEGYAVLEARNGRECMDTLQMNEVHLVILDIMLPDTDGLELCREIKAAYDLPILFLSALGENSQIIEGLRAGGDDYLAKPYDIGVLLARVEARLRDSLHQKRVVSWGRLKLDTISMIARFGEQDLLLTQKEFQLLLTLARNPGRLIGKEELYRNVWGASAGEDHRAIYTTVSRLNKKLAAQGAMLRVGFHRPEGYALESV